MRNTGCDNRESPYTNCMFTNECNRFYRFKTSKKVILSICGVHDCCDLNANAMNLR